MLIKIDLLSVECLDKIHTELDLLVQYGKIKPEATLKETYEKYLGIYSLERDNYGNYKMFSINGTTLTFTGNYSDIKSEFYKRDENGKIVTVDGKPQYLAEPINANKIVILLNIRCNIQVVYTESNQSLQDAYSGFVNGTKVDAGYY